MVGRYVSTGALAAVVSTACSQPGPTRPPLEPSTATRPCLDATRAIDAALALLRSGQAAARYTQDNPRTSERESDWTVKLDRVEENGVQVKPSEGWIVVNKSDCSAKWLPSR